MLKSKTLISIFVVIFVVIGWTIYTNVFEPGLGIFGEMTNKKIKIENDNGEIIELEVEVADEPDERQAGFQNVPKRVLNKKAILFVFGEDRMAFFHMRNVVSPLDIAFIKADGEIVEITKMVPGSPDVYGPPQAIRYTIEAKAGYFASKNISANKSRLVTESLT